MTPEERFTKIENFLSAVAEHQAHMAEHRARHDKEIQDLRDMQKSMTLAITKVAEAQRRTADAHRRTEETQQVTEKKLNALIDTVDRIIRRGGLPS